MAVDLEIEALAAHVDQVRMRQERHAIQTQYARERAVAKANAIRAYRALFLDDGGDLSALGAEVIADIAAIAQLGTFDPPNVTDAEMRERNGARRLALHILSRLDLDGSRLRKLSKTIREA